MKVTWLGQAGFLIEEAGKKIIIDPYLSDSCAKSNPNSYRRTPLDERYLAIKPDVIVLTHDHIDHTHKETLEHYLPGEGGILVLAAANAWNTVRTFGGANNYVRFCPGTHWTFEGLHFTAVKAEHSDPEAIGVVVDDGSRKLYFTGDTLYNEGVLASLPQDLFAVFLPVNGKGNNMNPTDAATFAERTGAKYAVPMHVGMFDTMTPDVFTAPNRVLPVAFQEVIFPEGAK